MAEVWSYLRRYRSGRHRVHRFTAGPALTR